LQKRILIIAHDHPLRLTRVALLEQAGYTVESVATDDEAMVLLEREQFDLILLGRKSKLPKKGIDQRLREKYPNLLTLKIEMGGQAESIFPSRIIDSAPHQVLTALTEMLGDGLRVVPISPVD
jgi:DNA-binding NtrC family response regulator